MWSAVIGARHMTIADFTLTFFSHLPGFLPPFALQQILTVINEETPEAKNTAFFFAALTFVANLSFAQKDIFKNWHTRRCYERTRGQLFCALHYKALKRQDLSGKTSTNDDERGGADLGKVVNLMQYELRFILMLVNLTFAEAMLMPSHIDSGNFLVYFQHQFALQSLWFFYTGS
jgi:hypothetical protein